jgi:hypothetical protein
MEKKRSVYKLGIVIFLIVATIGAYAWSVTGTHAQSSEALRYDKDRACATRPLSAGSRRAASDGSSCHVERLAVDRRDVEAGGTQTETAPGKSSGYVVTFANGPSRIRAALAAVPPAAVWESIRPGQTLDVQFFEGAISGFDLAGRFVATVGDPAVEPSEHAVGVAFIPLAFAYLFGIIALFALSPPRKPIPSSGGRKGAKPAGKPGAKPAVKVAKR